MFSGGRFPDIPFIEYAYALVLALILRPVLLVLDQLLLFPTVPEEDNTLFKGPKEEPKPKCWTIVFAIANPSLFDATPNPKWDTSFPKYACGKFSIIFTKSKTLLASFGNNDAKPFRGSYAKLTPNEA